MALNGLPQRVHGFGVPGEGRTEWAERQGGLALARLFGMPCGAAGGEPGQPDARGLFVLQTDGHSFSTGDMEMVRLQTGDDRCDAAWLHGPSGLGLESAFRFDGANGVLSRRDTLENKGREDIVLHRCLARFAFAPGRYQAYGQSSRWCEENDGAWQTLRHGGLVLGCEMGRTTQGSTPFLCLRDEEEGRAVAFHVVPKGNWIIRLSAPTNAGRALPFAVVDLGLSDADLRLRLAPGQRVELPEILVQELPDGTPHGAAHRLHRHLLARVNQPAPSPPVVYNTWFDAFECLEPNRLAVQLEAARGLGCEVFVVDAGWYGTGEGDWFSQAGDWREKSDGAFRGTMTSFAEAVRAAGLGFGLWMEPERVGPAAPVRREHPERFLPGEDGYAYPDLTRDDAYAWLLGEISRLIRTYGLAWIKLDFNFGLGTDPHGAEFLWYYEGWCRLMAAVRDAHPGVFVEGCASGGMRLDIASQAHCCAHFLSDNVNPWEGLRIYEGALARLLPGRLGRWVVLRPAGPGIPRYGRPLSEAAPAMLLTPKAAGWEACETVDVDMALLAAMPGVLGLSGDVAGLPATARERLAQGVALYKQWRTLIFNAAAHLLLPLPAEDRRGWTALQLQDQGSTESLLFVYRLNDSRGVRNIHPRALDAGRLYRLEWFGATGQTAEVRGDELMREGIAAEIADRNSALAVRLRPV